MQVKAQSPELLGLVADLKLRVTELRDRVAPMRTFVLKVPLLPPSVIWHYLIEMMGAYYAPFSHLLISQADSTWKPEHR